MLKIKLKLKKMLPHHGEVSTMQTLGKKIYPTLMLPHLKMMDLIHKIRLADTN